MAGLSINGTKEQNQRLQGTLDSVRKFCEPDLVSQLDQNKVIFDFDGKNSKREVEEIDKKDGKYNIHLPKNFSNIIRNAEDRGATICHALQHTKDAQSNDLILDMPSKQSEIRGIKAEESFRKNFSQDRTKLYIPRSEAEITKQINATPEYRCLPNESPTSKAEFHKARLATFACQVEKGTKDFINNFIKSGAIDPK